jgi:hypothetical protein
LIIRRRTWIAAGAIAAGIFVLTQLPRAIPAITRSAARPSVSQIVVPGGGPVQRLNLSPDGRSLAFVARARLFVRDLASDQERYVQGAENPGTPFWSPDGRWIAFVSGGRLKKVPSEGGLAQTLGAVNTNLAGGWSPTGDILIAPIGDGIFHIREWGGPFTRVTTLDSAAGEARHMMPQFLPDGRRFLYVAASGKSENHFLYASSVGSEKRDLIMPTPSGAIYTQGHLLCVVDRQIMAQPFDPATLRRTGAAYPVGGPVVTMTAAAANIGIPIFSAAGPVIAYSQGASIVIVRNWKR